MNLRAQNVSKQFIRKRNDSNVFYAVEDVSIELPEGEVTVLYGASGSGKSTLLTILAGILNPTSGQVFFGEEAIYGMEDGQLSSFRNEHIGMMPQGQTAIQSLTVLENILLPFDLYGTKKNKQAAERALELLNKIGIEELKDIMPSELSGGELRRMAIARALIKNPDVILADEPTADLDEENTEEVLKLLRTIANQGKAVFVVTHDNEVRRYADTVYYMNQGRLTKGE